jgi:hypothetical protein
MADPPTASANTSAIRLEVLKELQRLGENRDARDRLDRGPLAETKGREHWVLHLLLKAHEVEAARTDALVGSVYSNLTARLESLEDRLSHLEEVSKTADATVKERLEAVDKNVGDRMDAGFTRGSERLSNELSQKLAENLDRKWTPVGESVETFAQGSKQLLRGVDDTYRLAAQTRLLLNENARRISDLGRDILSLEEALKLVITKSLEQGLSSFESRLSAVENHVGLPTPNGDRKPASSEPAGL